MFEGMIIKQATDYPLAQILCGGPEQRWRSE